MTIHYSSVFDYIEDRIPNACFGKGNRTAYTLSDDSIDMLSDKFNINLWCEYGSTLNVFENGYVNLMKTKYDYRNECFIEEEIYVFNEKDKANLIFKERR